MFVRKVHIRDLNCPMPKGRDFTSLLGKIFLPFYFSPFGCIDKYMILILSSYDIF